MGDFTKKLEQNAAVNKGKGALDRITELEKEVQEIKDTFPRMMNALNQVFGKVTNDVSALKEVSNSHTSLLNEAKEGSVEQRILDLRNKRIAAEVEGQKAELQKALENGDIKPTDVVDENSLIVGFETDKDGAPVGPGHLQLMFNQLVPEVRDQMLGQAAGYKLATSTGGTFEILALYALVEKQPEQANLEKGVAELEKDLVQSA